MYCEPASHFDLESHPPLSFFQEHDHRLAEFRTQVHVIDMGAILDSLLCKMVRSDLADERKIVGGCDSGLGLLDC